MSARPAGDGRLCLCNSPNGGKVLQKAFGKKSWNFCHPLPSAFATHADVVEADPARPRGPLSSCISKQNPEHVTHATHPPPTVLPTADCVIKRARQRGTPARCSTHPILLLPGHPWLGFKCLLASHLASGNAVSICRSHGNELPPCLIHPTHHVSEQPPRVRPCQRCSHPPGVLRERCPSHRDRYKLNLPLSTLTETSSCITKHTSITKVPSASNPPAPD